MSAAADSVAAEATGAGPLAAIPSDNHIGFFEGEAGAAARQVRDLKARRVPLVHTLLRAAVQWQQSF